jgi:ATP-dependent RNA helicase RhlE
MQGRDIRASAQTGTGKTCAFVIPLVAKLLRQGRAHGASVLIVAPTRELANQVYEVVETLSRHTAIKSALIVGGANSTRQFRQLRAGADIVVATPGRLLDHIKQGNLSLKSIHTFVLDEADRMLDIGFLPDIRRLFSMLSGRQQTMLFSATFPGPVQQLVQQFLKNPHYVDLAHSAPSQNVTQMVYPVPHAQKGALLQAILEVGNIYSALIFCRTKRGASRLGQTLQRLGKSVAVIHSDKSQIQRTQALQGFKDSKFQILVATDIAARGIDVKGISHVINYNVPEKPEDYVHRIGRTGRAEAMGDAFTLVSPEEEAYLKRIENFIKKPIPRGVIPDFPYSSAPHVLSQQRPAHQHPSHQHPGPRHHPQRHPHHHEHKAGPPRPFDNRSGGNRPGDHRPGGAPQGHPATGSPRDSSGHGTAPSLHPKIHTHNNRPPQKSHFKKRFHWGR